MSAAMVCDSCGTVLPINARGEADGGEEAGWIEVRTQWGNFDCCTRSCVSALMDDPGFVAASEHQQQVIAEIAGIIREADNDEEDEA